MYKFIECVIEYVTSRKNLHRESHVKYNMQLRELVSQKIIRVFESLGKLPHLQTKSCFK
jgi:hypothetical protein